MVVDLTLKYNGLQKIALSNWFPTKQVTTLSHDFAILLYDIGIGAPVHTYTWAKYFFDLIMSHKLPLPALIFELLEGQKPLQEPNEFLSTPIQPYVLRLKDKGVITKSE